MRLRRVGLITVTLAVVLFAKNTAHSTEVTIAKPSTARQEPAFVTKMLTVKENRSYLFERYHAARSYEADDERGGVFLDASLFAPVGRVIIQRNGNDGSSSCSGVMVSRVHFLTAAHCFCSVLDVDARTAADCASSLGSLRLTIFLPQFGLLNASAVPIIHPAYASPANIQPAPVGNLNQKAGSVADLALVTISESVKEYFAIIPRRPLRPMLAGFGTLTITVAEYAASLGFEPGRPLAAGIGQMSRPAGLASSRRDCGRYHAADTICSRFSEPTVEDGPLQTAAVCQGDSGAALLQRGQDGAWGVIGIASYYSPRALVDSCLGDRPRVSHFVDVSHYTDWIATETRELPSTRPPLHMCVSALYLRGAFDILAFTGSITVTAFERVPSGTVRAPSITAIGAQKCRSEPRFGLAACDIAEPSYLAVHIESDFGQVTMCGR